MYKKSISAWSNFCLSLNRTPFARVVQNLKKTNQIVHIPTNIWPGDIHRANLLLEYYGAGPDHNLKNMWQLQMDAALHLHAFDWLNDLRMIGDNQARRFIRGHILTWIKIFKSPDLKIWDPPIAAERLSNWLNHYEFFGQSADEQFTAIFQKSFFSHLRYLAYPTLHMRPSYESILSLKAFIMGSLACAQSINNKNFKHFQKLMEDFKEILFRDGFLRDGIPDRQLSLIQHLIELRNFLRVCQEPQLAKNLQQIITKIIPPLRLLRHGDGRLSSLHGPSQYSSKLIDTALALSDVKGLYPQRSDEAGFERIGLKNNTILLCARFSHPFADSTGNLHFEWSQGKDRLIESCDLLLENQYGERLQSRAKAKIFRQITDEHGFIEAMTQDFHHTHTREIYLSSETDLRVSDKIKTTERAFGAIRILIGKELVAKAHQDKRTIILTDPKNNRFKLTFSGIEEINLESSSLLGSEKKAIVAFFQVTSNSEAHIKWSFVKGA